MRAKLFFLVVLIIANVISISACEIDLKIVGEEKQEYAVGDVVVVEVAITLTHRACPVAIKDTEFKYQGVKILGATPWKELSPMEYTRKIKVEITDSDKNISKIDAIRTCEKEGGAGSIKITRVE